MSENISQANSAQLAEIISQLFTNCNEKESRHANQFGVSIVEFKCLRTLYYNDGMNVNQVARNMALTSSRVTRIIDGLVEKKLVSREIGETDRRIYNLYLTKEGKKLASKLVENYLRIHEEILSIIPEEFHSSMIDTLLKLNNAVESWLKKA